MKTAIVLGTVCAVALLAAQTAAAAGTSNYVAEGKGAFIVDLRASGVVPEANDPIVTAAGADTGLRAKVGDSFMPTLGLKYFFTDNLAVEAVLGVTEHDAFAVAPGGASTKVHSTWVLPPVVTLMYHPFPKARVSPYVGAGVNAMVYFSGADYNGFKVHLRDEFGYAFQVGADIPVTGRWLINLDAKKVFTNTEAKINDGAYYSHIGLSPWVVSMGLGYRF